MYSNKNIYLTLGMDSMIYNIMTLCCFMGCPGCLIWHLIQMLICSSWEVTLKRFFHWLRIIGQMGSPLEHGCLCVWDSHDMTSAGDNNNIPHRGNWRLSWTELSVWFFLPQYCSNQWVSFQQTSEECNNNNNNSKKLSESTVDYA